MLKNNSLKNFDSEHFIHSHHLCALFPIADSESEDLNTFCLSVPSI